MGECIHGHPFDKFYAECCYVEKPLYFTPVATKNVFQCDTLRVEVEEIGKATVRVTVFKEGQEEPLSRETYGHS